MSSPVMMLPLLFAADTGGKAGREAGIILTTLRAFAFGITVVVSGVVFILQLCLQPLYLRRPGADVETGKQQQTCKDEDGELIADDIAAERATLHLFDFGGGRLAHGHILNRSGRLQLCACLCAR